MEELFVPFDLCKILVDDLGYDQGSLGEYYNEELYIPTYNGTTPCFSNIEAILWDQAFIFIAKKYDIHGHFETYEDNLYEKRVKFLRECVYRINQHMKKGDILDDGNMFGKTFSGEKYKGEYPSPKEDETYEEYRHRVMKCKEEGFHLGDLSWGDWRNYCIGAGYDENHSKNDLIYE